MPVSKNRRKNGKKKSCQANPHFVSVTQGNFDLSSIFKEMENLKDCNNPN
jgi:hypothetical protein